MADFQNNNFHEFSLKSGLFKGRPDLYFCYLKSEKIGHALARLLNAFDGEGHGLPDTLMRLSAYLPAAVARFTAAEFEENQVLVDVYELMSLTRLAVSQGFLDEGNAKVIVTEYEVVAEKIAMGKNASPFLSLEDFSVPALSLAEQNRNREAAIGHVSNHVKDVKSKGHIKDNNTKGQNERASSVLKIVIENKRVSIKDISKVIRGCSEKTIQRELNELIRQGLVRKEGDRRWSVYLPAAGETSR